MTAIRHPEVDDFRSTLPRAISTEPRPVAVRLDALTKSFAKRRSWTAMLRAPLAAPRLTALHPLTAEVYEGELFGLLGPNGSGKTTLFRILSTTLLPDSGSADIFGCDVVESSPEVRRLVGCVMANERALYWRLSAHENLRLFASLYGLTSAVAQRRASELLDLVGLGDVGEKLVGVFSSGMRQRLLIARALVPRPRLLLLDEPTRSLDPIAARDFRHFLRSDVAAGTGCTILLATHSSEEALSFCDRVGVLYGGRLVATGTAGELKHRFADRAFTVWTRTPEHAAFATLRDDASITELHTERADIAGWYTVRFVIGGALENASDIVRTLVTAGADVARFEQADIDLAELLQRVTRHSHNA